MIFISTRSPLTHVRVPLKLSQKGKVYQLLLFNVVSKGVCYLRTGQGWAELKGEEPGKAGRVVLFCFLKLFILFRGVRITQKGGKEGTTILGSD